MKIIETDWFVGNDVNFLLVGQILNECTKRRNKLKGF